MREFAAASIALTAVLLIACKQHGPAGPRPYAYPPWGFEATFPAQPKETDTPGDGINPHTFASEYQDATHDFEVLASDLSGREVNLDAMAEGASPFLAQSSGGVPGAKTYATTSDGLDGREYPLTKGGRAIGTLRFFIANGHFFQIAARSTLGPDDPALKSFLLSFRAVGAAPIATNAALAPVTNGAPSP